MHASQLSLDEIRELYLTAICSRVELDRRVLGNPGTTALGEPDRAGSGLASAYLLDQHMLVRSDPAVLERMADLFPTDETPTLDVVEATLAPYGEIRGRGSVQVIAASAVAPAAHEVRRLDRNEARDRQLITDLVAADPVGADDAEIDLDELDELIVGIESDGVLVAYASEFAWETDPRFADIGVLAHPDHRRQGYTGSVTRELCRRIFEQDRLPLYRHNLHNVASAGVARSVGFVRVASLTAATIRP